MGGAIPSLTVQVALYQVRVASALPSVQGVAHSPAAWVSSQSLVETQHLRLHPKPAESVRSQQGPLGEGPECTRR